MLVIFKCFHTFSTEITNYRAYSTVDGILNDRRHFKYIQKNVNMLECCRNGGCHLPTDVGMCMHMTPSAVEEFQNGTYLINMPRTFT